MKKILLCVAVLLCFSSVSFAEKWALIKDGKIVKWNQVVPGDTLKQAKLAAHGYLPLVKEETPVCDSATQIVTDSMSIEKDRVLQEYIVEERALSEAKENKTALMKSIALDKIKALLTKDLDSKDIEPVLVEIKTILSGIALAQDNQSLRGITYDTEKIIP